MQIISNGESMKAITKDFTVSWVIGSHTANVTGPRGVLDCFTFAWEKNRASMLDFTTALQSHLDYMEN